ncbi:ABC transporter ATP-binding protein [Priestia megaterium]|nr:ABC transporter ATP-binding protein [Priestia megaterium]
MIEITGLCKEFEGEDMEALKQVTLHVKKGSIYGLLGSNGAGKTTLLKTIAGIYKQDQGQVLIDEQPVFENTELKKRIIFLPDALYFFPQSTIKQLANFYRSVYPTWDEERFQKLHEAFPIELHKKVHRMSKGMQRQVAFWLALSAMPDVLILDEPLDGLDPVMRRKIKNLLVQDVAERQMTILISSHNLREVEDLCDHVGILHQGQLLIEKELDDLKSDVHKIQVAFDRDVPLAFYEDLEILYEEQRGSVQLCIVRGKQDKLVSRIRSYKPLIFDILPLTLEEIFIYEMGDVGYEIENIIV